ncbi:MAG: 2-phosphosulfolactate phosphatase [Clostridiales bacterium]|nr:2-phosphosulfolactate phosphatase [Clostridiales bacterium]
MVNCKILHLLSGAREATGLAVIIDVFRAFSLECYLYEFGAKLVRPVGSVDDAWALKAKIPDAVLVGERQGIKLDGFDFGNSPSQIEAAADRIAGRVVIHTTSAGTQGIVNAQNAQEILTGSFVNARAVAEYARVRAEKVGIPVSLVAMGTSGKERAAEDDLCAEYIEALIHKKEIPPVFEQRRQDLKNLDGRRFFDPSLAEHFPTKDYYMCIEKDIFPFVLRIGKDELGFYSEKM